MPDDILKTPQQLTDRELLIAMVEVVNELARNFRRIEKNEEKLQDADGYAISKEEKRLSDIEMLLEKYELKAMDSMIQKHEKILNDKQLISTITWKHLTILCSISIGSAVFGLTLATNLLHLGQVGAFLSGLFQ